MRGLLTLIVVVALSFFAASRGIDALMASGAHIPASTDRVQVEE